LEFDAASFAAVRNAFVPEARLRHDGYCGRGAASRSSSHFAVFDRYIALSPEAEIMEAVWRSKIAR
jgi:hypothetical protein